MAKKKDTVLGVIGGLGPASTVCFYDMLTRHTRAACDNDHIDVILSSHATTPDRTAFILGQSKENPLEVILKDARKLVDYGATMLAMPCNTAHYFYNAVHARVAVPIMHILGETVSYLRYCGVKKAGLFATVGTASAGGYQNICSDMGLSCVVPDNAGQALLMHIIYDQVKAGQTPDTAAYESLCTAMLEAGCETIIVGCTELSTIPVTHPDRFVDAMEVLACRTIFTCGKEPIGFPPKMLQWVKEVPPYASF